MGPRRKAREMALQSLYAMDLIGALDTANPEEHLFEKELWPESIALALRIMQGVMANSISIDSHIQESAKSWSLHRMNLIDRNILRIAAFELVYCDDIPTGVSINEALELAKAYSTEESRKFLNGILDRISKEKIPS